MSRARVAPARPQDRISMAPAASSAAERRTKAAAPKALSSEVRERRVRIIEAVLELAAEGGYEAVQLREISARSGVALRTIYKYFGSREALLGEAMLQWQEQLVAEANARMKGKTFVERI